LGFVFSIPMNDGNRIINKYEDLNFVRFDVGSDFTQPISQIS